jgi:hypothetical protein
MMTEADAITVLTTLARDNGPSWKDKLIKAWTTCQYKHLRMGDVEDYQLQRIRNRFGPTWLHNVRIECHEDA